MKKNMIIIKQISKFLDSKKAYFFSDDCFIETILNLINDEKMSGNEGINFNVHLF